MSSDELQGLITEAHRPELQDIDLRATREQVLVMVAEQFQVAEALGAVVVPVTEAIDAASERLASGGRLIYVGAGTAGRIGVLDAAECGPTFNTESVLGLIAGGRDALVRSDESAEDDEGAAATELARIGLSENDVVVGISASGRTPYVLGAIRSARRSSALTIGVACNPDAVLSAEVDHAIEVVVGPEVIAGSTRLKAGAAQKAVLNMFSTLGMIKLGKVYRNLMVDMRVTNEKLRARAIHIVMLATGADRDTALRALGSAGGDVKVAIVMLIAGVGPDDARGRLEKVSGRVRDAVALPR